MRLATNVIVAGGTIAAAVLLKMLVRFRRGKHVALDEPQGDMVIVAMESGLANVDPEPISHVAGEGIDLDRDVAAHESIAEQRDRLPR